MTPPLSKMNTLTVNHSGVFEREKSKEQNQPSTCFSLKGFTVSPLRGPFQEQTLTDQQPHRFVLSLPPQLVREFFFWLSSGLLGLGIL